MGGSGGFGGGGAGAQQGIGGGGGYDGGAGGGDVSGGDTSHYDTASADGYNFQIVVGTSGGQDASGNGLATFTFESPLASPTPEPSQMAVFALLAADLGGLILRAKNKQEA